MQGNLCFSCRNAVPDRRGRGCSWSRHFRPVEGWTAVPTHYCSYTAHGQRLEIHSYAVTACPAYAPDGRRCAHCGAPVPARSGRRYCSKDCWARAVLRQPLRGQNTASSPAAKPDGGRE